MKTCSKCRETKEFSFFHKNKSTYDGFQQQCKDCKKISDKKYLNSEKGKNYLKKSNSLRKNYKLNWKKTSEKGIACQKKESISEAKKARCAKYRQSEKGKKAARNYVSNLLKNPLYKLQHNIRKNLHDNFKKIGGYKKTKSINILGCSIEQFRDHLEAQFTDGMTWENQGRNGWHLDHIVPISLAMTEEEVIKLNHYTNFQPMWEKENISKSNRIDHVEPAHLEALGL